MGLYSGGLIIGRIFASEICGGGGGGGLIFGGVYFWRGLSEFYGLQCKHAIFNKMTYTFLTYVQNIPPLSSVNCITTIAFKDT